MNADQVRALVAAKWPNVLNSTLAQAMHAVSAMAELEASDADGVIRLAELRTIGLERARVCMEACGGWDVETLSVQIECAVDGELDAFECDDLAALVL